MPGSSRFPGALLGQNRTAILGGQAGNPAAAPAGRGCSAGSAGNKFAGDSKPVLFMELAGTQMRLRLAP